jgi:hypothetical protein
MRLTVPCRAVVSKGGSAIRADALPLTAFGLDETGARLDLERGVWIWCRGLERQGLLAEALARIGLATEEDGSSELTVSAHIQDRG